jgi:hypothetical protein
MTQPTITKGLVLHPEDEDDYNDLVQAAREDRMLVREILTLIIRQYFRERRMRK